MLSLPLVAIFFATLGVIWWLRKDRDGNRKGSKPIPGPMGVPLFGNVLQVGSKMHLKFYQWAEKYGKIYQIHLGNRGAVVISDPKWVKEILSNDVAFTGREIFEGFEMYENEPLGIASIEGEMWEVHRRFLLRQLRDFGFGKNTMEQMVTEEVKETIERLKSYKERPFNNVKEILRIAVVNSLWMIVGGKRFEHDDPKIVEMLASGDKFMKEIMKQAIVLFVPWTRYFMPKVKGLDEARKKATQFYVDSVDEHKETYQEDSLRDFTDVYLKEMKANSNDPKSMFYGDKAERQLHAVLADLFFAGNDTTTATLAWAVLYLTKNQHVQRKLQAEITSVTGDSRLVGLSDRAKMPYTMAVMEETFRKSSILPSGVQHKAIVGKEFKDYYIPKGYWIFPNLYHIHHDPKTWGDPDNFRPERFLSSDGKSFLKSENVMPFQVGLRRCVGEGLARDSFFLFLTNILQKFSINFDPNEPEPSMEPEISFVAAPHKYSITLKDRSS